MNTKVQYFKAVRPNGRDFHTNSVDYGAALVSGEVITHTSATQTSGDAGTYLSVSTVATDCTGMQWPCRLLLVEAVGDVQEAGSDLPNKRCVSALRVVAELPAQEVFGPNGEAVAALLERAWHLTADEADRLRTAWDAAWGATRDAAWGATRDATMDATRDATRDAAWDAAWAATRGATRGATRDATRDATRGATRDATRDAAWGATRGAARDAALALIVRDLISEEHFNTLYGPWVSVIEGAK